MGAFGIKALESDNGLDVIDFLQDYIAQKTEDKIDLILSEIIAALQGDLLGEDFDDIDFLYDNTAMALTELYMDYCQQGFMAYEAEQDARNLKKRVGSFSADKASLEFLHRYLTDIRDEAPDGDGEREMVVLWRESRNWEKWREHLKNLIVFVESKP